jgi:hypothetical protein
MQKFFAVAVLVITSLSFHVQVSAQASASTARPNLTKGDTWSYRVVDNWTDKELRQFQHEFAEVSTDNLVFRFTNKANNAVSTFRTDLDLNSCRAMKDSKELSCKGPYKFPLSIGQKTSYSKQPYANGNGFNDADCNIEAVEQLTVPAGSFETYKIACSGFWTTAVGEAYGGSFKETIWYAPSVKRFVKSYYENRSNRINRLLTRETIELIEYKVK